jgi:hypothetical protein
MCILLLEKVGGHVERLEGQSVLRLQPLYSRGESVCILWVRQQDGDD